MSPYLSLTQFFNWCDRISLQEDIPMKFPKLTSWLFFALSACVLAAPAALWAESPKGEEATVADGKAVSIEYTLRLEDKSVVDTNVGKEPFTYVQGSRQIIPGLEKALAGMKVGESKKVTVKPEEGYGEVNKEAFQEVKKELVPQEDLKVGAELQGRDSVGRVIRARVSEIKDDTVVLDLNHPLAGKTLYFDVKVLDIKDAPAGHAVMPQHP
jgi:FKBP-type peptidyl-prolyl cis-trans isomerase SlyD